MQKFLLFYSAIIQPVLMAAAFSGEPPQNRNAVKQPWETDLTDRLELIAGATAETAITAPGEPFAKATSRERLAELRPVPDQLFWWRCKMDFPATADPEWPVVLEWDESRLVTEVISTSGPLARPQRTRSIAWHGGEGTTPLPLTRENPSITLAFRSAWLTQLYENGFGRLRLRPAEFEEVLTLKEPPYNQNASGVTLLNRSFRSISATVTFTAEDFFGVVLAQQSVPVVIAGGAESSLQVPETTRAGREGVYKTKISIQSGSRRSLDYWNYSRPFRENHGRPEVLPLTGTWQWQKAPGATPKTPPSGEWIDTQRPEIADDAWTTHHFWFQKKFSIPSSWGDRRIRLNVGRVRTHAQIFIDGKAVGELAQWQTPAIVTLPENIRAGGNHTLSFLLTDVTVALPPGVAIPPDGTNSVPGLRNLAAPVEHDAPRLGAIELLGEPALRTEQAVIRTKGDTLETVLDLRNDRRDIATVHPVLSVLDRGKVLTRKELDPIRLEPGANRLYKSPSITIPGAVRWNCETPRLYELRVELFTPDKQLIDTRRERFGFREFAIEGDHFTLNGERINLLGNSHSFWDATNANTWPVRPTNNRFPRLYLGMTMSLNAADEMGLPTKLELTGHEAYHQERYAYQLDVLWQRLDTQLDAMARPFINSPAVVMLDVGNELYFKGDGEAARMVAAYQRRRTLDPTRLITNSGGGPSILPEVEMQDWHGWGEANNRSDWFFMNPAERPSYQKDRGFFAKPADGEDPKRWTLLGKDTPTDIPRDPDKLFALYGNKPVLFSEGHYNESRFLADLNGPSAYVRLPEFNGPRNLALHTLNWLAHRRQTVQATRAARFAGNIIHVDIGIGRWATPLAAVSVDRRSRGWAGDSIRTRYRIFHDLAGERTVSANFTLWDGEKMIAEKSFSQSMRGGSFADVDLDFPLPASNEDCDYRLNVRVSAEGYEGEFRDDRTITAFHRRELKLPADRTLSLFDPAGGTGAWLTKQNIPFKKINAIPDWTATATDSLLIGSNALDRSPAKALMHLRKQVQSGGRVVVLDHPYAPEFLERRITSNEKRTAVTSPAGGGASPLTKRLLRTDFQYWDTRENDWIVARGTMDLPSSGLTRVHLDAESSDQKPVSPLLELAEGAGRVVFSQMNFQDALGVDPAADVLMENLLAWPGAASPFAPATATSQARIGVLNPRHIALFRERLGVEGTVLPKPSPDGLRDATFILLDGSDPAVLAAWSAPAVATALKARLAAGATLFVQSPDAATSTWLTSLTGKELRLENHPQAIAYPLKPDPLLAGLMPQSFMWSQINSADIEKALPPDDTQPAHQRLTGKGFEPLTLPAYLGRISTGEGQVVVNTLRLFDAPQRKSLGLISTLLANAGARLTADGILDIQKTPARNDFTPVDLTPQLNEAVSGIPTGRQSLQGVPFQLASKVATLRGGENAIRELKGINLRRKADQLHFLQRFSPDAGPFIYRIYYTEDRKNWIFGKADPFIDVAAKPEAAGESAADPELLTWDNPNPEKEIESIDLILPSTFGSGTVSVHAITAARIIAGGGTPPPAELASVAPKVKAEDVFTSWRNERYGFVMLKDASIPVVYNHQGKPLARLNPWLMRGGNSDIGSQKGAPVAITFTDAEDGTRTYQTATRDIAGFATVTQRIVCRPRSLLVELTLTPTSLPPDGKIPNLHVGLDVLPTLENNIGRHGVNPMEAVTDAGTFSVGWSPKVNHWYKGYWIRGNGFSWIANSEQAWEIGKPITFWYEISI